MTPLRVPLWWMVLPNIHDGPEEIERLVCEVLKRMPLRTEDLAEQMDVSQSTVSRWASGKVRPSLKDMVRALEIVADETARLNDFALEVKGALGLVGEMTARLREKDHKAPRSQEAKLDGHVTRAMALIGLERE